MAEMNTDTAVDAAITRVQAALDALKAAQKKDDAEYADDAKKPKNLKEANDEALRQARASKSKPSQQTSESPAERARSNSDLQSGVPADKDHVK